MSKPVDLTELSAEGISLKEETPLQVVLKRFRRHKLAMISLGVMRASHADSSSGLHSAKCTTPWVTLIHAKP